MKRQFDYILGVPIVFLLSKLGGRTQDIPKNPVQKILVIKLAAAGDTILLIPVLKALRAALPEAQIHWLVSGVNREIAETVSTVDKLHVWGSVSISSFPTLIKKLRSEKYDAVVDLEQWARITPLIAYFSGASRRIGFDTPGQRRAALFTDKIPKSNDQHEIKEFFRAVSALTPLSENENLELMETERGQSEMQTWGKELAVMKGRPLVLFHPGCGSDGLPREWPLSEYALLGHWLIKTYKARLVLTGGPEEKSKTRGLTKLLSGEALDLGGKLSWQGLISLVNKMDLVVSGNTGVMHVAAAWHKPQVVLHGPTNSKLWGPLNAHAKVVQSGCPKCPCLVLGYEYHVLDQSCMRQIDVGEVKKAVSSLFDNS